MNRFSGVNRRRTPFPTFIVAIVLAGLLGVLAWMLRRENAVLANARHIKDVKYYADPVQWIGRRKFGELLLKKHRKDQGSC